jgi:HEAT repeat protein
MAEPTISSLIKLLGDEDVIVRTGASTALNGIGSKAILPLMKVLTNGNCRARAESAESLGFIGSEDPDVVAALVRSLKDKDAIVRGGVAASLGEIGKEPNVVVPALMEALQDTDASVRAFSAQALTKLGDKAKPAVPALLNALRDQDRIVRIRATSALLTIDPETPGLGMTRSELLKLILGTNVLKELPIEETIKSFDEGVGFGTNAPAKLPTQSGTNQPPPNPFE